MARCDSVRSSGFFTRAYLLFLMEAALALSSSATSGATSFLLGRPRLPVLGTTALASAFAACHSSRLTRSSASFAHSTTWKGSITHLALGHRLLTSVFIHLAPSAVTTSMALLCSRVSSSRNRFSTSLPYPSCAQTRHPRSWSTTTVRYLCPLL